MGWTVKMPTQTRYVRACACLDVFHSGESCTKKENKKQFCTRRMQFCTRRRKRTRINLEPGAKPLCCLSVITAEKVKQKSKSRLGPVTRRVVIYKVLMTGWTGLATPEK